MTLYVPAKLRSWRGQQVNLLPGVPLDGGPGIGFLVVYETETEAREAADGGAVLEISVDDEWYRAARSVRP